MKKGYRLIIRAVLSLVMAFFPVVKIWSCYDNYLFDDKKMILLFQKEIGGNEALAPFYYTNNFLDTYNPDPLNNDKNKNCREWSEFTNGSAKVADIYNVQYNLSSDEFAYCIHTGRWASLNDNTFIQWLLKPANMDAFQYFALAKNVEFTLFGEMDPWGEKQGPRNNEAIDSIVGFCLNKCKSGLPDFLVQRYAFQAVKGLYYKQFFKGGDSIDIGNGIAHDITPVIDIYNHYLKNKKTIIANWGQLYYALSFADRYTRSRNLLEVFDNCNEKKVFVFQHLLRSDLAPLLDSLDDKYSQSLYWAYKGLKTPGHALSAIQKVISLNPDNSCIPTLIGREVNKLEDWLLSHDVKGFNSGLEEHIFLINHVNVSYESYDYFGGKNRIKDRQYLVQFREYLESLLQARPPNRDLIRLAIVHLYHMEKNYAKAKEYLKQLKHLPIGNLETQRQVELAISIIYSQDIRLKQTQYQLENVLSMLDNTNAKRSVNGNFYSYPSTDNVISGLYLLLSRQYQKYGDEVKAGLFYRKSGVAINEYLGFITWNEDDEKKMGYYSKIGWFDKYASELQIDTLLALVHKKDKTPFEKRMVPEIWDDDYCFYDLKGTILIRKGRYEQALTVFNQIPDSFWMMTYQFESYLWPGSVTSVGSKEPISTGTGKIYEMPSKKLILGEIVSLLNQLKTEQDPEKKALLSYYLGNAYYNITYHGKDWMMFSYGKWCDEMDCMNRKREWGTYDFYPNNLTYGKVYYQCSRAIEMYQSALKLTTNKELAAQIVIMLGQCDCDLTEYKMCNMTVADRAKIKSEDYYLGYHSPWIEVLKDKYRETNVFAKLAATCPDVRD